MPNIERHKLGNGLSIFGMIRLHVIHLRVDKAPSMLGEEFWSATIYNQERKFVGDFSPKMAESGCVVKVIGICGPWQQGRTKRRGSLAKYIFAKLGPSNIEE